MSNFDRVANLVRTQGKLPKPPPGLPRALGDLLRPVNNLPMVFSNSLLTSTETITLPADSTAQWDMLRWAKCQGGVFIADRFGPIWTSGGVITPTDAADPFKLSVSACSGWALEEVLQEERFALNVAAPQLDTRIGGPTYFALMAERGAGRIVEFPVIVPDPAFRTTTFMEVSEEANRGVPLGVALAASVEGIDYSYIHDLRVPAFGAVYCDRNVNFNYQEIIPVDEDKGWSILRSHRILWFAPIDSTFEVIGTVAALRPWDQRDVTPAHKRGFVLANSADLTGERKLAFYINGALSSGSSSLDNAGINVVHGLDYATYKAYEDRPEITAKQPLHLRTVFKSLANAIHDICLAGYVDPGANWQYNVAFENPQIFVRLGLPQPQFTSE